MIGTTVSFKTASTGGQYLAYTCTEYHGANLNGVLFRPPGEEVQTPNLTSVGELPAWP